MAVKSDSTEIQSRVNTVVRLIRDGLSRPEILQYASEKTTWDVSERAIDEYIAKARKVFKKRSEVIRDEEFGKSLARLESLYARNMSITDFKAALAVQKEINAMLGLTAPEKHKHEGDITITVKRG